MGTSSTDSLTFCISVDVPLSDISCYHTVYAELELEEARTHKSAKTYAG